jgi:Na+/citrate or Na+/malate symporter
MFDSVFGFVKRYKWVIIIVMIAFFFSYFLGMTIGSVVDYRVRDALLNIKLPRPKVSRGEM